MRTTVDFNPRLLRKLRILASDNGMTLSKYVEFLIMTTLKSPELGQKKKVKFELVTVKGELVNSGIDFDRPSQILTEEDEEQDYHAKQ